jgi:hypothetical protein
LEQSIHSVKETIKVKIKSIIREKILSKIILGFKEEVVDGIHVDITGS